MLLAVDWLAAGPREIVVAGDIAAPSTRALLRAIRKTFLPQRIVAMSARETGARSSQAQELVPILAGKDPGPRGARAWVCRNYACGAPIDDEKALLAELAR
jgi:uncharacterized protein YyaL (SSP411 family)